MNKKTKLRLIGAGWISNGIILTLAWWIGSYLLYEKNLTWMADPLAALLTTHSLVKIGLTIWFFVEYGTEEAP